MDIPIKERRVPDFAGEAAIQRIVDDAIRPLCDGTLSPDTDNQIGWIKRFGGDCIISVGTGESYSHMEH